MNRRSFLARLSSALAVLPWVPKMGQATEPELIGSGLVSIRPAADRHGVC